MVIAYSETNNVPYQWLLLTQKPTMYLTIYQRCTIPYTNDVPYHIPPYHIPTMYHTIYHHTIYQLCTIPYTNDVPYHIPPYHLPTMYHTIYQRCTIPYTHHKLWDTHFTTLNIKRCRGNNNNDDPSVTRPHGRGNNI